jgi:hypothetical protein
MITQPINWPKDAPEYHSAKGWEFEKELAIKNIRNKMRDHKLSKMIERCGLLKRMIWIYFLNTMQSRFILLAGVLRGCAMPKHRSTQSTVYPDKPLTLSKWWSYIHREVKKLK